MNYKMKKILVIDDSPINLNLIEAIFSKRPEIQIVTATTGKQAIEEAQNQQFELIFLDIHLPDINGNEVTQKLRGSGINTPIIALTADATLENKNLCLEAGCTEFITKPVGVNELLSITRQYIPLVESGIVSMN